MTKRFECPDGLTCSGDGWDCVGEGVCSPVRAPSPAADVEVLIKGVSDYLEMSEHDVRHVVKHLAANGHLSTPVPDVEALQRAEALDGFLKRIHEDIINSPSGLMIELYDFLDGTIRAALLSQQPEGMDAQGLVPRQPWNVDNYEFEPSIEAINSALEAFKTGKPVNCIHTAHLAKAARLYATRPQLSAQDREDLVVVLYRSGDPYPLTVFRPKDTVGLSAGQKLEYGAGLFGKVVVLRCLM